MSDELIERLSMYTPNGNKILAKHLADLFSEYTSNGVPANADSFDCDQILGDEQMGYHTLPMYIARSASRR